MVIALASGCAVDESPTPPPWRGEVVVERVDVGGVEVVPDASPDLCALAEALPRDNVCSLVCDPDAFASRLADSGMNPGNCYQYRCDLGQDTVVSVGVCLP